MDDTVLDPLTQTSHDGATPDAPEPDASASHTPGPYTPGPYTPGLFDAPKPAEEAQREEAPRIEKDETAGGLIGEGEAILGLAAAVKGALQAKLSSEQFQTWFQRSRVVRIDDDAATVAVPNSFAKVWIERHYLSVLEECIASVLGARRKVVLRENPESLVNDGAPAPESVEEAQQRVRHEAPPAADVRPGSAPAQAPLQAPLGGTNLPRRALERRSADTREPVAPLSEYRTSSIPMAPGGPPADAVPGRAERPRSVGWNALDESSDFVLNSKCTFDTFVVGPCNRFGHAASMGAAEQPGKSYNPLFLHGRVGVGKTHLLQAFCFSVLERFPGSRILYLSCETFVNHFISALENGDTLTFRDKYRNIDVLVVDDIQILANKEKTQEEFFHTFNSLYNAGKQIVLSSDSPPKDIPTLQDRLVSRFKWGMVTEIEPPCFETRMAIVKRKSRDRGAELPDDVAQFIAENIEENVRELEGAVTRLFGFLRLNNAPVTLDVAREALAGLIEKRKGAPTVDDIISLVTEHYQVKLTDLQSKRRTKAIAFPRQVAMYLVRKVTRHSLEEIGGFFGGRDHTTVLYGVEKIDRLIGEDLEFSKRIQRFLEALV